MPLDGSRWRRWTTITCVVGAILLALAGSWAFLISLRPCRLNLQPGTVVDFHLLTEYAEIRDGEVLPARERSSRITLVCIGQGNEVALVEPDGAHSPEGISLMSMQEDGTTRLMGDDGLQQDGGRALGFFDFNLLPLPPGNEQHWKVSLVYAALPPGKRQVLAQVKRTANSSRPEFELRLPTVEWVNEHNRYVQVKKLVCNYRFDPSRGVVDRARVTCETGMEREHGTHNYRISVSLDLVGIQRGVGDTVALRDLALASAETQYALNAKRLERIVPLLQRLEKGGVAAPALREVAMRLRAEAQGRMRGDVPDARPQQHQQTQVQQPQRQVVQQQQQQPVPERLTPPPAGSNELQIASIVSSRKSAADGLVAKLQAKGIPAFIETSGKYLVVRAGPFASRDPALFAQVKSIAGSPPIWRTR